jgi:hypothetical protein
MKGNRNKQIAALLRAIADIIESDKKLPENIIEELNQLKSERQRFESKDSLGIFKILESEGADPLRSKLRQLSIQELKGIISFHRLDPSRKSSKWKNPDKLIGLIMDMAVNRAKHGDVFLS